MDVTWNHLEKLFNELVDVSNQEQQRRLQEIAKQNPSLANELQVLLASADETIDFTSNQEAEQILETSNLGPDSKLGRYRLIRQLGQGGMGVVYLAHREEDFTQQVAIKLGRLMLNPESSVQFRRERQILADLRHPNIARLLDGGTTETGAPFLVMEYVQGEAIDVHCRTRELGLVEVLKLFKKVCSGVAYAHQHLVIHRDIKPANIMVEKGGEPRLLDFGIAKIVAPDTAVTLTVAQAITPQYVSPEQVQGKSTTTLTDVYALGLLLYELLTGRRAQDVNSVDLSELQRVVIERDPEPLSRTLASADKLSAAGRELRQKSRQWQRDLQNIVLRALAKAPARRYPSVSALAADISRLMDGNPVEATGDSLFYRLGKLTRKYRYRFAALLVAAASIVALVIGLSWAAIVANQARDDAQRRLVQSQDLVGFMLGDLWQQLEPKVRLDILDSVGEKAMAYFASLVPADQSDESLAKTALALRQIGDVRMSQGEFAQAEAAFQRSMELTQSLYERDPDNNQRLFGLGQSHFWVGYATLRRGDNTGAREPFTHYLQLSKELVAREPDNLDWLLELSYAHNNLGTLNLQTGQASAARERFEQSLRLKRDLVAAEPNNIVWQMELADTLGWLADSEHRLGHLEPALNYRNERLSRIKQLAISQSDNKQINQALGYAAHTLALQLLTLGRVTDARNLFESTIKLADQRAAFDPENQKWLEDGARSRLDMTNLLTLQGEFESARRYLGEAQAMTERLLAKGDPTLAWQRDLHGRSVYQHALLFYLESELAQAHRKIEIALMLLRSLVEDHGDDLILTELYQRSLLLAGDIEQALCDPDAAVRQWQQVTNSVPGAHVEPAFRTPLNLALHTVAWRRLGQMEAADAGAMQLGSMGYASPWFLMFINLQFQNNDCNFQEKVPINDD